MADLYQDPVITKIFDLIRANTDIFKEFYYGDPIRVPASNLPAVILSREQTRIGNLNNAQDEHGMAMVMTIITDIRNDLSDYSNIVAGVNSLYSLVEGRSATYALNPQSMLYILRHNAELDVTNNLRIDLKTITAAEYGMTLGKRTEDGWAMEAQIKFVIHFTQTR